MSRYVNKQTNVYNPTSKRLLPYRAGHLKLIPTIDVKKA